MVYSIIFSARLEHYSISCIELLAIIVLQKREQSAQSEQFVARLPQMARLVLFRGIARKNVWWGPGLARYS